MSGRALSAGRQDHFAALALRRAETVGPFAAGIGIAGSLGIAALLRVPFLSTGLSPDEGGYAYVALQWGRGARLYGADWVDRPQGLILVYRLLLEAGGSALSIRLGAVVFGCAITLLVGVAGWLLRGPWTGAAASFVYAVVGVAPHLQGFTFNGELAASLPSTAAVVAALAWRRDRRVVWLGAGGVLGALGILMKQSGFDGLLVVLAVVCMDRQPGRGRRFLAVIAGAVLPLGLSALHGALVGWGNYWYAVVGYKLSSSSGAGASISHRLASLAGSWLGARRDLAIPAAVAAVLVALPLARRRQIRIPLLWLGAAFLGFNTAALYWPHYYVQLLPPLALLIAVGATSLPGQLTAICAIALVVGPALQKLTALDSMSTAAKVRVVPYYGQYLRDQQIARVVDRVTRPREPIYALDSEADLYFLADRPAAFPYLWAHPLEEIPGALAQLRALLGGPNRPRLLVEFRSPNRVDRTGALSRILTHDYRPLNTVDGIELLRANAEPHTMAVVSPATSLGRSRPANSAVLVVSAAGGFARPARRSRMISARIALAGSPLRRDASFLLASPHRDDARPPRLSRALSARAAADSHRRALLQQLDPRSFQSPLLVAAAHPGHGANSRQDQGSPPRERPPLAGARSCQPPSITGTSSNTLHRDFLRGTRSHH